MTGLQQAVEHALDPDAWSPENLGAAAVAGPHRDQAHAFGHAESFADGWPADVRFGHHRPLRREPCADRQFAAQNEALQLLHDLFMGPRGAYLREWRSRRLHAATKIPHS